MNKITEKSRRDDPDDLEKIIALPAKAVKSALISLGHLKPCWTCEQEAWVVETLKGKPTPLRLDGIVDGYTVAYQVTCTACGSIRLADAQTVFSKASAS